MSRTCKALTVAILASVFLPSASPGRVDPQNPKPSPAIALRIGGEVPQPIELTAEALARLAHQSVIIKGPDGKETNYEGVPIVELLRAAGVKLGPDLRGPGLATYLVVEATDGYRAVFALPEIDPAFTDRVILLADRRDGAPIDPKEGPLRVVVPGEKRHARWVKQVIAIKIGKA